MARYIRAIEAFANLLKISRTQIEVGLQEWLQVNIYAFTVLDLHLHMHVYI